jgi:hypothetical protein
MTPRSGTGHAPGAPMRTLLSITLVSALFAFGCSNGDDGTTSTGSTSSGSGGAGGTAPTCVDPATTPDAPCGTLSFAQSDVKSRKRNHHVTFLANTKAGPFIYVIGGTNGNFPITNVDRFPVNADGTLQPSNDESPMPVALGGLTGGVVSNVIVVAGGTKGTVVTDQSYAAVVGEDGTLGAWNSAGSVLKPRMHPGAVVKDDKIFVLGGFKDPDVWDDIVSATVTPDGTVSAWTAAGTLPGPRSHFAVTLVGDYAYLTGGLDKSAFSNPPTLKDTWRGHLLSDGTIGEWTMMPPLPVALATHASFFYGGYLYVGGGINTKHEKRMWRSPIDADHALGPWEETASLLIARGHVHQYPVFGNHVYSFAGAIDFNLNSTDEIDVGTFQ